jgi:hypothetical protein
MLSYHNNPEVKAELISRMQTHVELDELVQGATGDNGKGCTVWCALNNGKLKLGYNHKAFEDVLGLPEWLAKLQDQIFEGLIPEEAKVFSLEWPKAIPVGVDLTIVKYQFLKWVLKDGEFNTYRHCTPRGKAATDGVYVLLLRSELGETVPIDEWRKARADAYAAAADAAAADAAAYAAAYAYAAADAAAADAAAAYAADAYAARRRFYSAASVELLRLLRSVRG